MTIIVQAKMTVRMNERKIIAIKGLREITGMGLVDAKSYVEAQDGRVQLVRMTAEQLGKAMLVQAEWNAAQSFTYSGPVLEIYDIKRIDAVPEYRDFTTN